MAHSLRVRGTAATALSALFLSKGFKIVQASEPVRERLGIPFDPSPAEATVKDGNEPGVLVVVGRPSAVESALKHVAEELEYVAIWRARPNLHSLHRGRVVEKREDLCVVEVGGGARGLLERCHAGVGGEVLVSVARPAIFEGDEIVLKPEVRLDGLYVSVIVGSPRIEFSEHIRDRGKRAELSALALKALAGTGLGVRFRSNSQHAPEGEVYREMEALRDQALRLVKEAGSLPAPSQVHEGEALALVYLASPAKARLDSIRGRAAPTVPGHHSLKSLGAAELVDFAEFLARSGLVPAEAAGAVLDYVVQKNLGREIRVRHRKLSGGCLELSPGVDRKSVV